MMNRRSLLLGAGGLAACATLGPAAPTLPMAEELNAAVTAAMQRLNAAAGLCVAVYSREGVYAGGFGVTDVNTGEPADANTAFYIASATKPLTSLALLRRAERGEIDLDQPIGAFALDAPFPAAVRPSEVTFRHLLSHTSGIECDPISFRVAFSGQHTPDLLWRLLGASSVNAEAPLGTFEYTNTGYNIATVLTDRHFGSPWQEMLQTEVFGPAGMTHASARMSRATSDGWRVAKPHGALPEGVTRLYLEKTDATMQSAGGVIMSANDALKWLELMIEDGVVGGSRILTARSIEAARAPLATTAEGTEFAGYGRQAYGLGWYRGPYRDELLFHHFGGFSGARAHVSHIPPAAWASPPSSTTTPPPASSPTRWPISSTTAPPAGPTPERPSTPSSNALVARRDQFFDRVRADRANRAGRTWTLTRPRAAYAGAYENERFGRIDISAAGDALDVSYGVMHARAEPFTQPDSIRVELVPPSGESMVFEGPEAGPTVVRYDGDAYTRV